MQLLVLAQHTDAEQPCVCARSSVCHFSLTGMFLPLPPAGFDFQTYTACVFFTSKSLHISVWVYVDELSNTSLYPCCSHSLFVSAPYALGTKVILSLLQIYKVVHLWGHVLLVKICEGVYVSKSDTLPAAAKLKCSMLKERAAHSQRSPCSAFACKSASENLLIIS